MAKRDSRVSRMGVVKVAVFFFLVGLVTGPVSTTLVGLQVSTYTLEKEVRAAIVEQLSEVCIGRIRENVEKTTGLTYNERLDLARKWAIMPGKVSADYEAVTECSNKLMRMQ